MQNYEKVKSFKKIHVIGTSGCGKSTVAKQLAALLGYPHLELDSFFWKPNWQERTTEEFVDLLKKSLPSDNWIVDGNYESVREILWQPSVLVIWLNYSFWTIFTRVFFRSLRRIRNQEMLWADNQESYKMLFLSRKSILLWVLKTYWKRRKDYRKCFLDSKNSKLTVIEITKPHQAKEMLKNLQ